MGRAGVRVHVTDFFGVLAHREVIFLDHSPGYFPVLFGKFFLEGDGRAEIQQHQLVRHTLTTDQVIAEIRVGLHEAELEELAVHEVHQPGADGIANFLGLVGAGGYLAYSQIASVFFANPYLNGFILTVFVFGVLACMWQVVQVGESTSPRDTNSPWIPSSNSLWIMLWQRPQVSEMLKKLIVDSTCPGARMR